MWETLEKVNGATGRAAERQLPQTKWDRLVSGATEVALKMERSNWFRELFMGWNHQVLWLTHDEVEREMPSMPSCLLHTQQDAGDGGDTDRDVKQTSTGNLPAPKQSWVCWLTSSSVWRGPAQRLRARVREGTCYRIWASRRWFGDCARKWGFALLWVL